MFGRVSPTGTGYAVLLTSSVLVALSWMLGYMELAILGGSGITAFIAAAILVAGAPPLEIRRSIVPDHVMQDEMVLASLSLHNLSRRPSAAVRALDPVGKLGPVPLSLPRIPRGQSRVVDYGLPTKRRGVFDVGPLETNRRDVLGLIRGRRELGGKAVLVVQPRPLPLVGLLKGRSIGLDMAASQGDIQADASFHALREYEPGDDLRRIHWPATARSGDLIVREHLKTAQPHLTLMLDNRSSVYGSRASEGSDAFEEAVVTAASLVWLYCREEVPCVLFTTSGACVGPVRRTRDAGQVLDHLAALDLDPRARLDDAAVQLQQSVHRDGVVVITGRITTQDSRILTTLTRRFLRGLVVSMGADNADRQPASRLGPGTIEEPSAVAFARDWTAVVSQKS